MVKLKVLDHNSEEQALEKGIAKSSADQNRKFGCASMMTPPSQIKG
jgi:hypothetical protein